VLERLKTLKLPLAERQSVERIQAAVVLIGAGDTERFRRAADLAEKDWRDVLVWSGLDAGWEARLDDELGA
jgi:hypothetical protein